MNRHQPRIPQDSAVGVCQKQVEQEELTTDELCDLLNNIQIDSDEFISQEEINTGYAAITEAIRRLRNDNRREGADVAA